MNIANIVPTNDLGRFSQEDTVHLVLAHLVGDNDYTTFHKEMRKRGHYIILDNGAWEHLEPMGIKELWSKVKILEPDIVVAPDYPYKPWKKTAEAARDFAAASPERPGTKRTKIMFCPQCKEGDLDGLIEAYKWASNDVDWIDSIALSILNCPIAMGVPIMSEKAIYTRYQVLTTLLERDAFSRTKAHHLLGCFAPREIEWIEKIKMKCRIDNIETIDTSLAITCGMRGIWFDTSETGAQFGKPKEKLNFMSHVSQTFYSTVNYNIQYLKGMSSEAMEFSEVEAKMYKELKRVLAMAFDRASKGKGHERHADLEPFEKQIGCHIARNLGSGFPLGQAVKKIYESQRREKGAAIGELLGAIIYLAVAVLVTEEKKDA